MSSRAITLRSAADVDIIMITDKSVGAVRGSGANTRRGYYAVTDLRRHHLLLLWESVACLADRRKNAMMGAAIAMTLAPAWSQCILREGRLPAGQSGPTQGHEPKLPSDACAFGSDGAGSWPLSAPDDPRSAHNKPHIGPACISNKPQFCPTVALTTVPSRIAPDPPVAC